MTELTLPYAGRVYFSSPFGWRTLNAVPGWHGGIDLVGLDEKVIRAPADGVIAVSAMVPREGDATRTWEWGNYVRLDADGEEGYRIYLCHMEKRLVSAGQRVRAGDPVGIEGSTGYSFGSHCHFEVRQAGTEIDPTALLGIENRAGVTLTGFPRGGSNAQGDGGEEEAGEDASGKSPRWYDEAMRWAADNGIIRGVGGGDLAPDAPCTRAMAAQMLYNYHRAAERSGSVKRE